MFMLSLIFVSFQVEANLSNVLILEIKLSRGEVDWDQEGGVDWDQEGRWTGIKRGGGLGSRGKVDWDQEGRWIGMPLILPHLIFQ